MNFGFWIWQAQNCEGGDPAKIASEAKRIGLSTVYLKVADGAYKDNVTDKGYDYCPPIVKALREAGISVWGWHYMYGFPKAEVAIALKRIEELQLDGYILDVEQEFKTSDGASKGEQICKGLKTGAPNMKLGVASYRFPKWHMDFPWKPFLDYCDYNFPQMYWEQAHDSGAELERCVREFKSTFTQQLPIRPIGPTYTNKGWAPAASEIEEFVKTAKLLNLDTLSFFSWDECKRSLPHLWELVGNLANPGDNSQVMSAVNDVMNAVANLNKACDVLSQSLKAKGIL